MHDTLRRRWRSTLLFALLQLPLIWLIALRYLPFLAIPDDPMGIAYLVLTWIGHFGMLALLAWLPLGVLALFLKARWLWLPAALLAAIGLCALLLDTGVYAQYRFHVNYFMVSLFLNDTNGEIFSFEATTWLVVGASVIVVLLLEGWLARRLIVKASGMRLPVGWACAVVLVTLIGSHLLHVVGDARYQRSVTQQVGVYPLLFPATAKDFMAKHGWLDPRAARAAKADVDAEQAQNLNWPRNPLSCQAGSDAPNVLVVLIDSWRADEYGPENTPNLYAALNPNGRRYLNHYSGGNATRNGTMSLFYSLTGNYYAYLDDTQTPPLLVTQLQKENYPLGLFSSASLDGVGFDRTIFSSVQPLRLRTEGSSPAERDRRLTDEWLAWLDEREHEDAQPWFGMLFYDAPHGYDVPAGAPEPFQPSKPMDYLELGPDTDPQPFSNRHRNAVHYDDAQLGRVIDDLKAKGEWDKTLLVVTADHAQSFNDFGKNYWGHNGNFASPQTQVPMIVNGPGVDPGQVEGMTSHLDVAPMLMRHVLGCTNPLDDYAMGEDLLDPKIDHPWVQASSYIDYGIIEPDRITVVDGTGKYDIVDRQLNPIPDAEFSPAVFEAMQWFRQFYR